MNTKALAKLCVDSINNPSQVAHYSNGADVETAIRKQFYNLMGTEVPTMKDIRRHKIAIFEILEEVLTETYLRGVAEDEFFMNFAEIRNVALGDAVDFYVEDDGILVVSEHSGNHWDISRQKLEGGVAFPVRTKAWAIGVYGDFFLFVTGRLSFGRLVDKAAQAMRYKVYEEVAASFAGLGATLPPQFVATGTYDEDTLIDLVAHVEAATGQPAIVLGTRKALAQVTAGLNVGYWSNSMKDEKNDTGTLEYVNGMRLMRLPQVFKQNTFDFAYDDNQLLIIPQFSDRFIKLVFEGDALVKETTDHTENNDMSWEFKFITRFGAGIVLSTLLAVYTLA